MKFVTSSKKYDDAALPGCTVVTTFQKLELKINFSYRYICKAWIMKKSRNLRLIESKIDFIWKTSPVQNKVDNEKHCNCTITVGTLQIKIDEKHIFEL